MSQTIRRRPVNTSLPAAVLPLNPISAVAQPRIRPSMAPEVQPVAIAQPPANDTAPGVGHNSEAVDNSAFVEKLSAFWVANTVANKAKREADAAKKALDAWMVGNNITSDSAFVDMPNGARVQVAASIAEVSEDYIDVRKLQKLVDADEFMRIISATKTAVEASAGTNIVISATSTRMKAATLSVKEVK